MNRKPQSDAHLIQSIDEDLSVFHENQRFFDSQIYLNLAKRKHSWWVVIASWIIFGFLLIWMGMAFHSWANYFGENSLIIKGGFYLIFLSLSAPFIFVLVRMTYLRVSKNNDQIATG